MFDDGLLITLNEYLRSWDTFGKLLTASTTEGAHIKGGFYRPVQNILYFFIYQFFGLSTFAFHLINIVLHAVNACLIFSLGKKLKFSHGATFCAALIWALHPIHTEAVTYMSSTADMLFVMFSLWGLLILLPDFTARKIWVTIPLFLIGLLSKESMIVFPALVIVTMYFVKDTRLQPKTYLSTWPLWCLMLVYVAWRITTPHFDGPGTYAVIFENPQYKSLKVYSENLSLRFYTFFATLPAYLQLLVWPTDLRMERNFPIHLNMTPKAITGLIILLIVSAYILLIRTRKGLPLSWGLLWFGAAHFPNTGLIIVSNALFLEHWMYLPSIGLFLGMAQSIFLALGEQRIQRAKPIIAGLVTIAALALAFATHKQNMVWQNPFTFYTNIFKHGEITARAHNNLAMAYSEKGQFDKAVVEYRRAIEISDTYAETRHNLAVALLNLPDREERIPEALQELDRALEIDPNFYRAYLALMNIALYQKQMDKAEAYKKKAEDILNKNKP